MLPFTAEVLSSLLQSYHREVWPAQILAQILALALALGGLWLAARPGMALQWPGVRRIADALLAAAWAWSGSVFHLQHLASIDFMAPVYGALFLIQAIAVAWSGVIARGWKVRAEDSPLVWAGGLLVAFAVVASPLITAAAGGVWADARVVGIDPSATAVFTLGLLLLAKGRTPLHLAAIPVLWTLIAGAIAWTLGITVDRPLPLLGLGALGLMVWRNRRLRRG